MGLKKSNKKPKRKSKTLKKNQIPGANEKFSLDNYKLTATDKKIFKLQQEYPELRQREIAKILNIDEATVSRSCNKPAYKNAVHDIERDWLDQLAGARNAAAQRLVGLIKSKDENIAFKVSKEILQLSKVDIGLQNTSKSKTEEISEIIREVVSVSGFGDESPGDQEAPLQPQPV